MYLVRLIAPVLPLLGLALAATVPRDNKFTPELDAKTGVELRAHNHTYVEKVIQPGLGKNSEGFGGPGQDPYWRSWMIQFDRQSSGAVYDRLQVQLSIFNHDDLWDQAARNFYDETIPAIAKPRYPAPKKKLICTIFPKEPLPYNPNSTDITRTYVDLWAEPPYIRYGDIQLGPVKGLEMHCE